MRSVGDDEGLTRDGRVADLGVAVLFAVAVKLTLAEPTRPAPLEMVTQEALVAVSCIRYPWSQRRCWGHR